MNRLIMACAAVAALSACEVDRLGATSFARGISSSTFSFEARSNNIYPLNSSEGEAYRMSQLQEWLDDNSMCARGFEITSRSSVHAAGAVHIISYDGRCKG